VRPRRNQGGPRAVSGSGSPIPPNFPMLTPPAQTPARGVLSWAVMTLVSAGLATQHPKTPRLCSVRLEATVEAAQMTATIIGLLCVVLGVGALLTCVCLAVSWEILHPPSSEDKEPTP
jgi:hypothetical protein